MGSQLFRMKTAFIYMYKIPRERAKINKKKKKSAGSWAMAKHVKAVKRPTLWWFVNRITSMQCFSLLQWTLTTWIAQMASFLCHKWPLTAWETLMTLFGKCHL